MINKEFVSFEIALKLKELGFDEECLGYYCDTSNLLDNKLYIGEGVAYNTIKAPLFQQVFDWFIEKYNLFIDIQKWIVKYYVNEELQTPRFIFDIDTYDSYSDDWIYQSINDDLKYSSYYEAREAAILKTIGIIETKDKSIEEKNTTTNSTIETKSIPINYFEKKRCEEIIQNILKYTKSW